MKYFLRAVKFFVSTCAMVALALLVLVLLGLVSSDIDVMFVQGWTSVGKIALMFAAVSAIYPRFGYRTQMAHVLGELEGLRGDVISCMEDRGYVLESENGDTLTFRSRSTLHRIFRLGEDRITVTKALGGFEVEGLSRDIFRLANALEYRFRDRENPEQ